MDYIFSIASQVLYLACRKSCPKSIINVDDGNPISAGREHGE